MRLASVSARASSSASVALFNIASTSRPSRFARSIDDQAWLADNRAKIVATRARLIEGMRALGFDACESQANFVWCTHRERPHRPFYEALKAQGLLIRFMNYAGWGDGLRITVGTDDEIDAFLAVMKTL